MGSEVPGGSREDLILGCVYIPRRVCWGKKLYKLIEVTCLPDSF